MDELAGERPVAARNGVTPIAAPVEGGDHRRAGARSPPRDPQEDSRRPAPRWRPTPPECRSSADPNENTSVRPLPGTSSRAGAWASGRSRPAPAVLIPARCSAPSVSSRPAAPQSSTWLFASTQQSIPAARRQGTLSGLHAVIDALGLPLPARGDGGLQVDDSRIGRRAPEHLQGIPPDVGEVHGPRNRAVRGFCQLDIAEGRLQIGFVEVRVRGVGQHLVDASARHHVAAQEQLHGGLVVRPAMPVLDESSSVHSHPAWVGCRRRAVARKARKAGRAALRCDQGGTGGGRGRAEANRGRPGGDHGKDPGPSVAKRRGVYLQPARGRGRLEAVPVPPVRRRGPGRVGWREEGDGSVLDKSEITGAILAGGRARRMGVRTRG